MDNESKQKIRRNFVFLLESLTIGIGDLSAYYYENDLIEDMRLETIEHMTSERDKAYYLLRSVQRKCPNVRCPNPFQTFVDGLQIKGFEACAEALQKTDISTPKPPNIGEASSISQRKMSPEEKQKIRMKYFRLCDCLYTEALLPHLYQMYVFELNDIERISLLPTDKERASSLLNILLSKEITHLNQNPFEVFLYCLKVTEQVSLANDLRATIVDANLEKVDELWRCLGGGFELCEGSRVTLPEITSFVVEECSKQNERCQWSSTDIHHAVKSAFQNVEEIHTEEKQVCFLNLRKIDVAMTSTTFTNNALKSCASGNQLTPEPSINHISNTVESVGTEPANTPTNNTIEDMTIEDVSRWLSRKGFSESIITQFKSGLIDGLALAHYTADDLRNDFSEIPPGVRKNIIVHRDRMRQTSGSLTALELEAQSTSDSPEENSDAFPMSNPMSEGFRGFDVPVDMTFKYMENSRFPPSDRRPGDLLHPVRHYVQMDLDKIKAVPLAHEIAGLVCAALNERMNTTIYFGVKENGDVTGTRLSKDPFSFDVFVTQILKKCFYDDQLAIILRCVRPCRFIPVIITKGKEDLGPLYVTEIDIKPSAHLCLEETFAVKMPEKYGNVLEYGEATIFRYLDGTPQAIFGKQLMEFMNEKKHISDNRKHAEGEKIKTQTKPYDKELGRKLIDLLQLDVNSDKYPILVMNSPREDLDFRHLKFIKDIEWKAVFDFDAEGKIQQYLEEKDELIARIITSVNDLNPRSKENKNNPEKLDKIKLLQEEIKAPQGLPWIFSNGHIPTQKCLYSSLLEWKRKERESFKESVRFFDEEIPDDRAIIVILLLSKDTEIMLEAVDELCTVFEDQWVCITDSNNIAEPWIDQMQRRAVSDKETILDRSVVGIPWRDVENVIDQCVGLPTSGVCHLPTSFGVSIPLTERNKTDFSDLIILSSKECENSEMSKDPIALEQFRARVEHNFYHGNEVSWWNYYLDDCVLRRDKHGELHRKVYASLNHSDPNDDQKVSVVTLFHHPGSGGTTTARHILWEFRENHRCVIVRSITDKTSQQILDLRSYRDPHPRPVLVLLDNLDEEKVKLLIAHLDEGGRRAMQEGAPDQVTCVLLVLTRCMHMNRATHFMQRLILENALTPRELLWFRNKNKYLVKQFKSGACMDPKYLISFNILKENFNKEYMLQTVKQYTANLNEKERKLLTYVAVINCFDANRKAVPSSAFDNMMIDNLFERRGIRYGLRAKRTRWENHLSTDIKVLLNETTSTGMGSIKAFRIIHFQLTKYILKVMMADGDTVSSIIMDLLNNRDLFCFKSAARDQLLMIVQSLVRHRVRRPDGMPETKFAPIVEEIIGNEGTECASKVMLKCFELTEDPFVAQQLARICIHEQNWKSAEIYAEKAVALKPQNSYFWDTYAQVYKEQVRQIKVFHSEDGKVLEMGEGLKMIMIAMRAMDTFRKEQQVSENEKIGSFPNPAGYHGELEVILILLDCLKFLPVFHNKSKKVLHQFLVDKEIEPEELCAWKDVDGINILEKIKNLESDAKLLFDQLQDEHVQLKESVVVDPRTSIRQGSIVSWKAQLDTYFGEPNCEVPKDLSPEQTCKYRRRLLYSLGGKCLHSVFKLLEEEGGQCVLERMQYLVTQNLESEHCSADDLQWVISINFALLSLDNRFHQIPYEKMILWSRELYKLRNTQNLHLEAYLFYTMLNWPRKCVAEYETPKKIKDAIKHWKDAYYEKYPTQREVCKPIRKKDATVFFLAYGSNLNSFVTKKDLGDVAASHHIEFWNNPDILKRLHRFSGILTHEGREVHVNIEYGQGHKDTIPIQTAYPVKNSDLWNKTVYFVIGFSWIGPKAFNILRKDPSEDPTYLEYIVLAERVPQPQERSHNNPRRYNQASCTLLDELQTVEQELQVIADIKQSLESNRCPPTETQKLILAREQKLRRDKGRLIRERQREDNRRQKRKYKRK